MDDCVFCKIVRGEIPADFIFQDDKIAVFRDIKPVKPIHLLIIPKKHISDYTLVAAEILVAIKERISRLVSEMDLANKGYRVEVNGGSAMGIPHLHFHLLAPIGVAEEV